MKYYLYTHIGSGNRGCEATARSLSYLLNRNREQFCVFSEDYEEEKRCNTEEYATVLYTPQISGIHPISSLIPRLLTKMRIDKLGSVKFRYKSLFEQIMKQDIGLSTGGDVFCYDSNLANKIGYLTDEMKKRGKKVFLIACSIEKRNLTPELLSILNKFDYIFPREHITQSYLKECGIEKTSVFPDPAFALPIEPINEKYIIEGKRYIGLNYSIYTNNGLGENERFSTIIKFIQKVLVDTEMDIILIPHVYWSEENDLMLLKKIKEYFRNEKRVILIEKNYKSPQLKYIISKCEVFIGARTHSVIGAYSSGVPALALGYSIKSKGIAQDIFGKYEEYVFDSNQLSCFEDFYKSFEFIMKNKEEIKEILIQRNKEFREKLDCQIKLIKKLGEC